MDPTAEFIVEVNADVRPAIAPMYTDAGIRLWPSRGRDRARPRVVSLEKVRRIWKSLNSSHINLVVDGATVPLIYFPSGLRLRAELLRTASHSTLSICDQSFHTHFIGSAVGYHNHSHEPRNVSRAAGSGSPASWLLILSAGGIDSPTYGQQADLPLNTQRLHTLQALPAKPASAAPPPWPTRACIFDHGPMGPTVMTVRARSGCSDGR